MPKVYIVSNGGHDFSKAAQFGNVVFLSTGIINKFRITEMAREFAHIMADSTPNDFLIPNGPTAMSSIACSIFAWKHGKLNLLLWKKGRTNEEDYYERRIVDLNMLIGGG
jgi:hypothetical protein